MSQVADEKDPAAERKATRSKGTFEELAKRYVDEYAKRKNKSWKQADALVRKHLVPRWGKLQVASIARADVKNAIASIKAPIVANQVLAAASALFNWGIKEDILKVNPCRLVDRHDTKSRERVLSESEIPKFWKGFDSAGLLASTSLKLILLLGQRPGEIAHLRREHIVDGWWTLPGEPIPALNWPGTKNAHTHRIWIPEAARALLAELDGEGNQPFRGVHHDGAMRDICAALRVERATPHDLRRTNGTTITKLGFGRPAMNRIQNHVEGGIADVYDQHGYDNENKKILETVAAHIMALAEGREPPSNVTQFPVGAQGA
jgi:integrase